MLFWSSLLHSFASIIDNRQVKCSWAGFSKQQLGAILIHFNSSLIRMCFKAAFFLKLSMICEEV